MSSHSEQIDKIYQQYDKLYRAQINFLLCLFIPSDEGTEVVQGVEQYAGEKAAPLRENQGKYHSVDQRETNL